LQILLQLRSYIFVVVFFKNLLYLLGIVKTATNQNGDKTTGKWTVWWIKMNM